MNRTTRVAALVAATLALVAPILGVHTAAAAPNSAAAPTMTLVAQDPWTAIGADLHLQVRIPAALVAPDGSLSLVAAQPVTSRAGFDRVVATGTSGSVLDQVVLPLSALPTDATGARDITIGLESATGPRDPQRLSLRRAGVYPLTLDVRDGQDRSRSTFTTMAVVVTAGADGAPQPLPSRLGVAWVWPLSAGPSTLPDGSTDPAVAADLRPSGRLGRQASALNRAGDVPLTLAPGPETLEAWVDLGRNDASIGRGAAAVRDAGGRAQVVTGSYVPTDIPSLLGAKLDTAVDGELVRGDETLARLFGTRPDPRTVLARPVDAASLARLRAGGADRVIVDSAALVPTSSRTTSPNRPFALQPAPSLIPSGPVPAVAGDAGIEQLLVGDDPPALRAQRVLAALSVEAAATPTAPRAVVIVNPNDLDPPSTLLDAVLTGLRGNPWLEPMTIGDVFDRIPPETTASGAPVIRELAPSSPPSPPIGLPLYTETQDRITAFRSLAGTDDPVANSGDRSLLLSESSTLTGAAGTLRARATLGAVDLDINRFLSGISVPKPSTITLTSRSGEIPLTFRNDTGKDVDVLIELESPKLFFPKGSVVQATLPPKSTTVRFAVEARTSGTFPLRLTVRSADGALEVADTRFRVRSTAVSTVGIALMAGAAVFLALWWVVHIRRTRRARRARRSEVAVA